MSEKKKKDKNEKKIQKKKDKERNRELFEGLASQLFNNILEIATGQVKPILAKDKEYISKILKSNQRIPQELLNLEKIYKCFSNEELPSELFLPHSLFLEKLYSLRSN